MYNWADINADLIVNDYFKNDHGVKTWINKSSYGKVNLKGTILGWLQVDKEYTA